MVLEKRLIDRKLLFFDELGEPTKLSEKEFYEAYEKREIEISADQPYLGRFRMCGTSLQIFHASPKNMEMRHCVDASIWTT
jgi:hypothetical protein